MAVSRVPEQKAILLNDNKDLREYLKFLRAGQFIWSAFEHRISGHEWLKLHDDFTESEFQTSVTFGIPIIRLSRFVPDGNAVSLLDAKAARRFRAVPVMLDGDDCVIAMEHPDDKDALESLGFLCKPKVVPLLASASDIHFRPGPDGTDILFRIDGELMPVRRLVSSLHRAITARVKVLGRMNLAEHRKPQDGRSNFTLDDGRVIDLRISVLPSIHGESVVIRLLDTMQSLWSIDQIGLEPADRRRLEDVMERSHGIFLTTGPTGCGKSTTLYAMLTEMRKQRVNILTIEDPVEFHIADIQQMQVNRSAGFTFASALRNFLRHDPDIIMVGEIRDRETAAIAVESALTGHLVLSTLHTNTAATTVTRLLDLGIEPYLLRASLLAVMAQRLVRLTCERCKEPEAVPAHMRAYFGLAEDEVFHTGRGCSHCDGMGIKFRKAVYELLVVTPKVQELIVAGAEAEKIQQVAVAEGMRPLTQAALAMARRGEISLAEAWRVRAG